MQGAAKAGLLLRSLPGLRWEQIVYRPLRVCQYRAYRYFPALTPRWTSLRPVPSPSSSGIDRIRSVVSSLPHLNTPLDEVAARLSDLDSNRFTFLNAAYTLDAIDWNHRYGSHLWNYQLHYFGYAWWCARAWVERKDETAFENLRRLVRSWIEQARPGVSDGWGAYTVSLRAVNWIYSYALVVDGCPDEEFLSVWRASIRGQLDFLRRHIEHHLLANHILKNAKALLVGGLFCEDEKLFGEGERLLRREMREQVLDDGGHYERSPMYHALALADLLECCALLRAFNRIDGAREREFTDRLQSMAGFMAAMTYGDGRLALFNDSANTEESRPRPILDSCEYVLGRAASGFPYAFPQTGYYLWASRDGDERMIVDAGPPSVEYNAAHAHCDLLSYEMYIAGRPFVVDTGVHGYDDDPHRERARSTRAHNTVVFDGREQSEVWGTFRMARRARIEKAEASGDGNAWDFTGEYSPYYDRRMIHNRRIERSADGEWTITDRVRGGRTEYATSYIHLHPDVEAKLGGMRVECNVGGEKVFIEPFGVNELALRSAMYFPDFGVAVDNPQICLRLDVKEGEAFGYRIKR
ncbi:MAG: alginate lyase family protein [Acidobacteria bacterium]|nr:alginate lyase family protein [Acidobacteriota bacterium]